MSEISVSNEKIVEELQTALGDLIRKDWKHMQDILVSEAEITLSVSHEIKLTGDGADVKTKLSFARKYTDTRKGKVYADGQGDLFDEPESQAEQTPEAPETPQLNPHVSRLPEAIPADVADLADDDYDVEAGDE